MEKFIKKIENYNLEYMAKLPSILEIQKFVDQVIDFMFPMRLCHEAAKKSSVEDLNNLKSTFSKLIACVLNEDEVEKTTASFFATLENVFEKLKLDAAAILEFDPAAKSLVEVISAYPGFYAVSIYRIAFEMKKLNIPYLPRIISEHAHSKTGIDINPGAQIGKSFFIDHGTGVVIGETTIIGDSVKIYQGVTLGALQVAKELANTKRHPTIEKNVIIYSGATILGGNTIIGKNTVIGGNVWLTESVPSYSLVFAQHETKIRDKKEYTQAIDFNI